MPKASTAATRRAAAVADARAERSAYAERLKENHAQIAAATAATAGERSRFLLAQSPLFRDFLGADEAEKETGDGKKGETVGGWAGGKKKVARTRKTPERAAENTLVGDAVRSGKARVRMTEKEEDHQLLEDAGDAFLPTKIEMQPSNIRGKMRPYQIEGLNFIVELFERGVSSILADEMGLGKTLQAISVLAFLRLHKNITGPHIVIVPLCTLGNWMNELERWCPEIHAVRFHGNADARQVQCDQQLRLGKFDVVVTTYETLLQEYRFLSKIHWRFLIIDEAHRLKNETTLFAARARMLTAQSKLLLTGTPLQNNLHELWAMLNFLFADVFGSADYFEQWFGSVEKMSTDGEKVGSEEGAKDETVHQLHSLLRPFLIRRLKSDVERALLPKKETVLFTQLTEKQLSMYQAILRNDLSALNGKGGNTKRLLNILMHLRKASNHPYLFEGSEDRTLDPFGEHLVTSSGKLTLLDLLLPRLKAGGHRVLLFSQFVRVLDILEDYAQMRGYKICRLDGNDNARRRDAQISEYNREGSDKFLFLLSTRAGGLGINLQTADTVIFYDSDWNAQVDLQAMDRAHRIGQKKQVNVYRLITESTVEERMLRVAMAKLKLDSLVIQQGRLAPQKKKLERNDLLDIVRAGADQFLRPNAAKLGDLDLDKILERGSKKTDALKKEIAAEIGTSNMDRVDYSITRENGEPERKFTVYDFRGEDFRGKRVGEEYFHLDMGKRVRTKRRQSLNEKDMRRQVDFNGEVILPKDFHPHQAASVPRTVPSRGTQQFVSSAPGATQPQYVQSFGAPHSQYYPVPVSAWHQQQQLGVPQYYGAPHSQVFGAPYAQQIPAPPAYQPGSASQQEFASWQPLQFSPTGQHYPDAHSYPRFGLSTPGAVGIPVAAAAKPRGFGVSPSAAPLQMRQPSVLPIPSLATVRSTRPIDLAGQVPALGLPGAAVKPIESIDLTGDVAPRLTDTVHRDREGAGSSKAALECIDLTGET